ncbi:MAG: hypothetical protein P8Q35_02505 [Candidatus Thalassarchaeaceae archaeon]|nr:hypothetical protein [Candidatus Thalassarchaeaceae archaeon]
MSKGQSLTMTIILLFSLIIGIPQVVNAEDGEILIDSAVEWVDDQTFSDNLRIVNGGSLTISSAVISMEDDAKIIVEEGGELNIDSSEVNALNPPTELRGYGYSDEENRSAILIPGSDYDSDFSVTFHAPEGESFYGGLAYIGVNEQVDIDGSEFTIEFNDSTNDIWIGLIGIGNKQVCVSSITIAPDLGTEITYDAVEMQFRNMMAKGDAGFSISISGNLDIQDSTIYGGEIIVDGSALIHNSNIAFTGPIIAESIDSNVSITGTTEFSMSKDDHDVRLHAKSQFHWGDEATGSGGHTDRWERRVSNQQVEFDAINVLFRVINMGPDEVTSPTYISDENGIGNINSGNERVVEIGWADGSVWTENAEIEIVEYRTGWNMDLDLENYGGVYISLSWEPIIVIDSNIPYLEWLTLEINNTEEQAALDLGVQMAATITNQGTASAVFFLSCEVTETGVSTSVTPTFPGGEKIDPGTEVTIYFTWRHNTEGDAGITCNILTPSQLVDDDAFGGGSASSASINWYQPDDDEEGSAIPILIALLVGAAITGFASYRMMQRTSSDEEDNK